MIINLLQNFKRLAIPLGPGVAQRLRQCATSRRVSGSIPGGVTGVNPASKNEYQDTPGGIDVRCVRVTTL